MQRRHPTPPRRPPTPDEQKRTAAGVISGAVLGGVIAGAPGVVAGLIIGGIFAAIVNQQRGRQDR